VLIIQTYSRNVPASSFKCDTWYIKAVSCFSSDLLEIREHFSIRPRTTHLKSFPVYYLSIILPFDTSRNSSVGIVTKVRARRPRIRLLIGESVKGFNCLPRCPDLLWGLPRLSVSGYRGHFFSPGVKFTTRLHLAPSDVSPLPHVRSCRAQECFHLYASGSIHIRCGTTRHDTTRHDTTRRDKSSVHSHLLSVNIQATYSLLSIPATLSLSLAVGDGLKSIRACENHKRIFCRVVWLCPVV
jgi:hypothetical protein